MWHRKEQRVIGSEWGQLWNRTVSGDDHGGRQPADRTHIRVEMCLIRGRECDPDALHENADAE